jgi:hypothetical protein
MTIIIGALLDDGRKVVVADGNVCTNSDERIASNCVKVRRVDTTLKARKALIAVAGKLSELQLFGDVVRGYISAPEPHPDDLFYRLTDKYKTMGIECKSHCIAWLPSGDTHVLVDISSDFCARVEDECNFLTNGSGGVAARATLLGLAWKAAAELRVETHPFPLSDVTWKAHLKVWKPSWDDVVTAYEVACMTDLYCGGVQSVLSF